MDFGVGHGGDVAALQVNVAALQVNVAAYHHDAVVKKTVCHASFNEKTGCKVHNAKFS